MNGLPIKILAVDDSPSTLEVLERNLTGAGYSVRTAPGVTEAIEVLEQHSTDLVITDLRMPKIDGLDLIRHVRSNHPDIGIIMITGFGTIESAVSAVKEGAEEYVTKPFTDDELLAAVEKTITSVRQRRATDIDGSGTATGVRFGLIGESTAMKRVFRAIEKAATTSATVLITGESGTGKELVARAIHYGGSRAAASFVPVNCGGIPEGLVESELFGHVKGAFTGATTTRAGFFITADRGTIFLDEIGELTLPAQAKLLRVLQDNDVQMVGAARPRSVDVRVIAATNKDLNALVRRSVFREDLFFRLNVITIDLPPLREREEDIVTLVGHFLAKFARQSDKQVLQLSDRAWRCLRDYHWPGNVRELENVIHRLVVMTDGDEIDAVDLPTLMRYAVPRGDQTHRTLAEVEAVYIRDVLASVDGNKTQAAEILGIDRKTLREALKRFELSNNPDDSGKSI